MSKLVPVRAYYTKYDRKVRAVLSEDGQRFWEFNGHRLHEETTEYLISYINAVADVPSHWGVVDTSIPEEYLSRG